MIPSTATTGSDTSSDQAVKILAYRSGALTMRAPLLLSRQTGFLSVTPRWYTDRKRERGGKRHETVSEMRMGTAR